MKVPVFPHTERIRLAQLNFFWLCPDVAKYLSCWLSQFRKNPQNWGTPGPPPEPPGGNYGGHPGQQQQYQQNQYGGPPNRGGRGGYYNY